MPHDEPAAFWEDRYAERDRIWSGAANASLVSAVADLPVGDALELGCGEGGDTLWLASRGWRVTAVDISATAVGRARVAAASRGVRDDQVSWHVADLTSWQPQGEFDLVTACFLHSPAQFPRSAVLRRFAAAVRPGGHLLVVGHAETPPWARHHDHAPTLVSVEDEVAELALDPSAWDVVIQEARPRPATGPDGQQATLRDSVVLARRH